MECSSPKIPVSHENNTDDDSGVPAVATETITDDVTHSERDGHLAGGGGGSVRWGAAMSGEKRTATAAKDPLADLCKCNPCLDAMGLHLRKRRPATMDPVYVNLMGDCALPVLDEAERATVDPKLLRIIEGVHDETTLQEFYIQVGTYSCVLILRRNHRPVTR